MGPKFTRHQLCAAQQAAWQRGHPQHSSVTRSITVLPLPVHRWLLSAHLGIDVTRDLCAFYFTMYKTLPFFLPWVPGCHTLSTAQPATPALWGRQQAELRTGGLETGGQGAWQAIYSVEHCKRPSLVRLALDLILWYGLLESQLVAPTTITISTVYLGGQIVRILQAATGLYAPPAAVARQLVHHRESQWHCRSAGIPRATSARQQKGCQYSTLVAHAAQRAAGMRGNCTHRSK